MSTPEQAEQLAKELTQGPPSTPNYMYQESVARWMAERIEATLREREAATWEAAKKKSYEIVQKLRDNNTPFTFMSLTAHIADAMQCHFF